MTNARAAADKKGGKCSVLNMVALAAVALCATALAAAAVVAAADTTNKIRAPYNKR
jgi:hypothetical protein